MIEVGDKVLYKPINHSNYLLDKNHRWYAKVATVIANETLNRYWIAFDEFPNCNNRDRVNRFCADKEELIKINRKGK
jgi:hypothetical protein